MASSRTRKRKQQRRAAILRRADNARWAALTRGQKSIEDPERLLSEDMVEAMKRAYMPYLLEMLDNDLAVTRRMSDPRPLTVVGKSYIYALHTNKKPPTAGG